MSSKAKNTKDVNIISSLRAFETTLRAISRHNCVPVHRPLIDALQACQEASKPLSEVILTGVQGEQVAAVVDCLASYPNAKTLACICCSSGDKGLIAIAALLQASGSKWWHGSRLEVVELSGECHLLQQRSGAERAVATANSTAAQDCAAAYGADGAAAAILGKQSNSHIQQRTGVRPATAPAQQQHASQCAAVSPSGICPTLPEYLQLPSGKHSWQQAGDDARLRGLRPVHYRVHTTRSLVEIRSWALAPTLGPNCSRPLPQGAHPTTVGSCNSRGSSVSRSCSSSPPSVCCFTANALQQFCLALSVTGLVLQRLVLDHTPLGDVGVSMLASGIGCCRSLKVLGLRYCKFGARGAQQLCEALIPSGKATDASATNYSARAGASASRMSKAVGTQQPEPPLADAATPSMLPVEAGASCSTAKPSTDCRSQASPCLLELYMDGNPFGAAGLHAVSKAVRLIASLRVLSLADISLDSTTEKSQLEVQVLAHALLAGPSELITLDFSNNSISEECAMYFLGMLKGKPSCCVLKLTPRLAQGLVQQMATVLDEHQHAAKAARAPKKVKK